jgi:hypothetical protein
MHPSKGRISRALAVAFVPVAFLALERAAAAAPPYVDRPITLPKHDWAFDLGGGVGHYDFGGPNQGTEVGLNFEMAVAPIRHLELGIRTGVRPMNPRHIHADEYGRLYDRQTWGTRLGAVANPEFRIRGELVDTEIFELGLEGRLYLPVEPDPRFATVFGVPMALHLGGVAKMDFGIYTPLLFYNPTVFGVSIPFDVMFQVTDKLWLGPLTNFKYFDPGGGNPTFTDFLLGFGLGYQFTSFLDLKTQIYWPAIDNDNGAANFGAGVGVQIRIE